MVPQDGVGPQEGQHGGLGREPTTRTECERVHQSARLHRRRRRILTSDDDVPMVQQLHLDDNTAERQAGSCSVAVHVLVDKEGAQRR